MNNVWTAIALRAPSALRQTTRQPVIQLYNGTLQHACRPLQNITTRVERASRWRQQFATSAVLQKAAGKKKKVQQSQSTLKRREDSPPTSPSKLEPAPTVASHTEGLPEEEEILTWRDYDPEGGMPLPNGELSQAQLNGIFGSEDLDADTGNYTLSVMYWRRQSGALIDSGLNFPQDSGVGREKALRGLEYVRSLSPDFDEQAAGQVWAEEESLRLQNQLQDRAVSLGLYKPTEDDTAAERESYPEMNDGRSRTEESALTRLREENKALLAAKDAEREAAQERADTARLATHRGPLQLAGGVQPPTQTQLTPSGGITITRPTMKAWLQTVERKPWVKYYEQRAHLIQDQTIPQMSYLRRLGPSFITLMAILAACVYLSDNYTPPPKSARIWPDTPPSVATLAGLSGMLVAFFILGRVPPLWRTYSKYFTLVPAYPYSLSLIGAIFRHDTPSHLLINGASLWFFGSLLHDDVGRGTFIAIFIASGAIGGFASLAYNVLRSNYMIYIFGSSGATLGVLAASCVLRPNGNIRILGYDIPIAAWVFLGIYGIGEVVAVRRMLQGNIDHVGHIGGIVAGAACALWLRMRLSQQQRQDRKPIGVDEDVGKRAATA